MNSAISQVKSWLFPVHSMTIQRNNNSIYPGHTSYPWKPIEQKHIKSADTYQTEYMRNYGDYITVNHRTIPIKRAWMA